MPSTTTTHASPPGTITWSSPSPSAVSATSRGRTAFELFRHGLSVGGPSAACLGYRPRPPAAAAPYKWLSYGAVDAAAVAVAQRLLGEMRLRPGEAVGIYGKNCPAWTVVMLAASAAGVVLVPLYDTLGVDAVRYVCSHAGVRAVFCSDENVDTFVESWTQLEALESVVVFGPEGVEDEPRVGDKVREDGRVFTLDQIAKGGGGGEWVLREPDLDEAYLYCYTSGSTGNPKGVVLSNRMLVTAVSNGLEWLRHHDLELLPSDTLFSFLPLAHIFAQQTEANIYAVGGKLAYYRGDIRLLLDDMSEAAPSVFAAVPRVYARFQQKILEAVAGSSWIKRVLFDYAYNQQVHNVANGRGRISIWDKLLFNKVRAGLLPNAKIVITGSAPLSPETNDFLKVCLNAPVMQGFGMTETLGGISCAPPFSSPSGHCGPPLPGVTLRLVDLPEMGYTVSDQPYPRGELCVKGDQITTRYYNNEEATKEAFTDDGFFRTGDVGLMLPDGSLKIIDRAKNLFKLSQGEYVSPEAIEGELVKAKLVGQIYVYGNSVESTLVAVVVPDPAATVTWGKSKAPAVTNFADICAQESFKVDLLEEMAEQAAVSKLKRYEYIKDILIETEVNDLGQGFNVQNQLMTPSFKLRRPQLSKKYKAQLEELYAAMK